MADITEEVTTATTWAAIIAAVITSVGITVAVVISDIAGTAATSADIAEAAIGAIIEAIGIGGTTGIGAADIITVAGGAVVGGPMASALAGAGRRITTASSGFATKAT